MRTWSRGLPFLLLVSCRPAAQEGTIVIRAGTVLDGRGETARSMDIVVQGDRIVRVTPSGTTPATYDLSQLVVMPGGIDTHVHVTSHFDGDGRAHLNPGSPELREHTMPFAAENARATLEAGITTIQSLGAPVDRDLRDAIAGGTIPGPRVLTSLEWVTEEAGDTAALRALVSKRVADGADVIKIFASRSLRDAGAPTLSEDELRAACGAARTHGRRSVVHAHAAESARRTIRAGCTTIEHGTLVDAGTLRLMAERGTYFDPHLHLIFQNYFDNKERFLGLGNYTEEGFAHMRRAVPIALELFKQALATPDLRIVFGTDAVAGAHGRNWEELIYRVQQGGQAPMAAIVSATSLAAASLGLADRIGTIAAGMEADIIAVDGDPAHNITALRQTRFVMKGGRVYRHDSPR